MDAIIEATVQLLLSDGPARLSTTRVARRAGVSIGTLYQYFPNKQVLLFVVLERHLASLSDAIVNACRADNGATPEAITEGIVEAYVAAKMAQADVSPILYRVAADLDPRALVDTATARSVAAIEAALASGTGRPFRDPRVLAMTLTAALYGTLPPFCPRILSVDNGREAQKQLTLMFRSYVAAHR